MIKQKRPGRPPADQRNWYQKAADNLVDFFGSKLFVFSFTIFALLPMIYHSSQVYRTFVPGANDFLVYTYATVLDAATMIAVLRSNLGKFKVAWWSLIYASMSFGINICLLFDVQDWIGKMLIAFMIPFTITYFSHEIPKMKRHAR